MQTLGLSHEEMRAYERTLVTPGHRREIDVLVLTLDGDVVGHWSGRVQSGAVTYSTKRDAPLAVCTMTLLDPSGSLRFEPDSPSESPIHRKFMVQVVDLRYVTELDLWVECIVFTGPVYDFDRNGAEVNIVAHSLEIQAMGDAWHRRNFPAETQKTHVIKELLADCGETALGGIPEKKKTTRNRIIAHRMKPRWPLIRRVVASTNEVIFYNGPGKPIVRPRPSRMSYTFGARQLLSEVSIGYDDRDKPNTFIVKGKNPKGPRPAPRAVVSFPPNHPGSPKDLARNGKKLRLVEETEREHAKTKADCMAIAKRKRDEAMQVTTNYEFDSMPIPHLEPWDLVGVVTPTGKVGVRMREWTFPLTPGDPMHVGSLLRRSSR